MEKNRNLLISFRNALTGMAFGIRSERNLKIHLGIAAAVLILGFVYHISLIEFCILIITIGAVLICELFNTALEVIVDMIVDEFHPKAKIAKDVAAGAVFISTVIAVLVGILIFIGRIFPQVG